MVIGLWFWVPIPKPGFSHTLILSELPQKDFNPIVSSCILGLEISHQGRRDVGAVGTFAT